MALLIAVVSIVFIVEFYNKKERNYKKKTESILRHKTRQINHLKFYIHKLQAKNKKREIDRKNLVKILNHVQTENILLNEEYKRAN